MNRLLLRLALAAVLAGLLPCPAAAREGGYTFNRVVFWSEEGDPYPRFERDPETGAFSLLFPGPVPETGWDPVEARRLVLHGPAFIPAEPIPILRPRDPDPDWASRSLEASFDLNRDGAAELVRARTVMIPDNRDPSGGQQRVLVEVQEGDRTLFGDLLEGPEGGAVRARSISTADFTGEGYPDMMVRLESKNRGGIAFYSQAALRSVQAASRVIPGFSPTAFHADRYGIFDLNRSPRDFFSRLPYGARAEPSSCASNPRGVDRDGHGHCRFDFNSPYLGWIREFRVDFLPDLRIVSFELFFPSGNSALEPREALDFLIPVLGGGYRTETRSEGKDTQQFWIWRGKGSTARLSALQSGEKSRAVSLLLERN